MITAHWMTNSIFYSERGGVMVVLVLRLALSICLPERCDDGVFLHTQALNRIVIISSNDIN